MGLFRSSQPKEPAAAEVTAPAGDVAEGKHKIASKAAAKTTTPAKELTEAEKLQAQKDKETLEMAQLLAGAPDEAAQQRAQKKFIGSNTRHMYLDGLLGTAVYTFSGLQHITGQSNALTLLSMWAAGTTFLINAGLRHHLNDVTRGLLPAPLTPTPTPTTTTATVKAQKSDSPSTVTGATLQAAATPAAASMIASAGLLVDYDTQRRNVFQLEAVASWIWMLAALQQFRVHKRLRWCGYSSWSGLGCVAYYSMRYLYNVLVE